MSTKEDEDRWARNFPTSEIKKITTIKLKDDEAALIMDSNDNISVYFPNMDEDDDVPNYVQFISALAYVATTDQEVIDLIWEKFHKLIEEETN